MANADAEQTAQEPPHSEGQDDDAPASSEHQTLKYHLLGPSLTKSGQDGVDQKKVSEIIYNASKGSKFFNNEEVRDRALTEKINRILARKRQLERINLASDLRRADEYIAELELSRDLSQVLVHVDCDAFYAACEELDRPELKDVPFAVGKGVLTTCNYHARKFGCRSAMAGFVAKKLCPELIFVPLDFVKYGKKAEEVRAVFAEYDPRFESASMDEAYLNITQYCEEHHMEPEDVVSQMRAEIHEKCGITVSAGLAANAKLAKICSNKNKPNGQFSLPRDRASIMAFMKTLPTRKVNGIGRVFERELDAIGVKTCGDIYDLRAYLSKLFGEKAFEFLMQCYLGLGRTQVQPSEDYERKSVGTESTFSELSGKAELRDKLRHIAEELQKDLERTQFKGRTLVLKIKFHTYEVLTRQTAPPFAIHKAEDLYKYSEPMLARLEKEHPNLRLRLMGLRMTHLISTKKEDIDFFGLSKRQNFGITSAEPHAKKPRVDDDGWEVWPEAEFEEAARQERESEMHDLEQLSQELETKEEDEQVRSARQWKDITAAKKAATPRQPQEVELWNCPICGLPQPADDRALNDHIDYCLSRQAIKEVARDTSLREPVVDPLHSSSAQTSRAAGNPSSTPLKRKRGRPRSDKLTSTGNGTIQKSFFPVMKDDKLN